MTEARDWSVRGLRAPSSAEESLAARLGVEVYDGREEAERAGLRSAERTPRRIGRGAFFLPLPGRHRLAG